MENQDKNTPVANTVFTPGQVVTGSSYPSAQQSTVVQQQPIQSASTSVYEAPILPDANSLETLPTTPGTSELNTITTPSSPTPVAPPAKKPLLNKAFVAIGVAAVIIVLSVASLAGIISRRNTSQLQSPAESVNEQGITLGSATPDVLSVLQLKGSQDKLIVNGDLITTGRLSLASENFYGQFVINNLTENREYFLPDSSGTVCLDTNNCNFATTGSGVNSINGATGAFTLGEGLGLQGTTILNTQTPTPATTVNGSSGAITIQGTANQINVATNGTVITLTTPQDIATTSSPTFAGVTSTTLTVTGGNASLNGVAYTLPSLQGTGVLANDGSGGLTWVAVGGACPTCFLNGGNSFGGPAILGTNDSNSLVIRTNGASAATFAVGGATTFQNTTDSTSGFRVLDADGGHPVLNVDTTNEWVGIGTATPTHPLHVIGVGIRQERFSGTAQFLGDRAQGTQDAPTAVGNNTLLAITGRGYDGTNYINAGQIAIATDGGGVGTNDMPGRITFATTADGASSQTERMRLTSTGLLEIASTSAGGTVEKFRVNTPTTVDNLAASTLATGATTSKALVLQGEAGQTANLQEWQNSAGTVMASIGATGAALFQNTTDSTTGFKVMDADGGTSVFNVDTTNERVGIGTDAPDAKLHVVSSSTSSTAGTEYGQHIAFTDTGAVSTGTDTTYGLYTEVTRTGGSGTGVIVTYGNYGQAVGDTGGISTVIGSGGVGGGGDVSYGVGGSGVALGSATELSGVYGNISSVGFTGTLTTVNALQGFMDMTTAGTYTTANGLLIKSTTNSGGGTITSNYGAHIQAQTVGISDYGLRIDAADTQTLWVSGNADNTTASAGIAFGASRDTNLYRSGADTLKTDDNLVTGGTLTVEGGGASTIAGTLDTAGHGAFGAGAALNSCAYAVCGTITNVLHLAEATTATSGIATGLSNELRIDPGADSVAAYAGNINYVQTRDGNAFNINGGLSAIYGTFNSVDILGAGIVSNAVGTYTKVSGDASANITNSYGLLVDTNNITGVTANNYGAIIKAQTAGTADYGLAIEAADTQTLWLSSNADNTTAAAGIAFGSSRDTNLYRSAANTLRTDDSLIVGGTATIQGSALNLGVASTTSGSAVFYNSGGAGNIALSATNPGASSYAILLPAASGTVCLTSGNCAGVGGTGDILNGGNTTGSTVTIGTNDGNSLVLETNNQPALTIASGGATTLQNATDSTSGFRVMDTDGGTPILNVDTTNERVGIGTATPGNTLDVVGSTDISGHLAVGGDAAVSATTVLSVSETYTGAGGLLYGMGSTVTLNPSAAMLGGVATYGLVTTQAGNVQDVTVARAVAGQFDHNGTGTVGSASGFYALVNNNSTGVITEAAGLTVDAATNSAGTINSNYGILVQPQTAGTADYGIAIGTADTQTLWIGNEADGTTANAGIAFGLSRDTNLYRSAANTLKTDNDLVVGSQLAVGSSAAITSGQVLRVNEIYTNTGGIQYGINNSITADPSGASTAQTYGAMNQAKTQAGNANNSAALIGTQARADHAGSGTVSVAYGGYGYASTNSGNITLAAGTVGQFDNASTTATAATANGVWGNVNNTQTGTITTANALQGLVQNLGAGTITTANGVLIGLANSNASGTVGTNNGINIQNPTNAGTITTNYGINIAAQTAGTSDYGVAIGAADTQTLWLSSNADNTTAAAGIAFGSSRDTNLYRLAADTLRTDDMFSVGTLGTTDTATYLCRNSSNIIAACSGTGAGAAFLHGGNSFGEGAILGTNDAQPLFFETSNTTRAAFATTGEFHIGNGVTNASPTTGSLQGTGGSGTNIAGASLNIAGGRGTGSAVGGGINFQTTAAGGSGSSLNSLTTVASLAGGTGAALFQNAANSTQAFQVANSAGTSLLNVNTLTSGLNLVANPNFEQNTNGWSAMGNATIILDDTASNANFGARTLKIATASGGNDGASYRFPFTSSTTYAVSFYAKLDSGSASTFSFGRADNGSDTNCLSGQTINTTWTQFTCSFTTGITIGSSANFYIKDSGTHNIFIDGVTLVSGSTALAYTNPAQNLQVGSAMNNVTLNYQNTGEPQQWNANANALNAARYYGRAVVANGYIYLVGGDGGSAATNTVQYARINNDGSTGTWATTSALPATREDGGVAYGNGYIYYIGGDDTNNGTSATSTIYYTKVNTDGTLGTWQTNATTWGATRNRTSTVILNGYIYTFSGGNVATSYFAKLNADGSVGPSVQTTANFSANRNRNAAVVANGYIYVLGGDSTSTATATVSYARPAANGDISAWTNASNSLPAARYDGSAVAANGYLYYLGGTTNGTTGNLNVYYTKLNTDGSTGTWQTAINTLPNSLYRASAVTANGYVYHIGGATGNTTAVDTVYYSSLPRVQIGGSLDLVGLSGAGGLSDGSDTGSVGGSLTAGSTKIVGSLDVQGSSSFANNVYINRDLTVKGSATFQSDKIGGMTVMTGQNSLEDVWVQGRYLYGVSNGTTDLFRVIDVSNPTNPTAIATLATSDNPNAVTVQGRYAYVVSTTGATLQVIDIANPKAPTIVSTTSLGVGAFDIAVQGRYAYITPNSGSSFIAYDISNPAAPVSAGTVTTASSMQKVFVQGNYAYITLAGSTDRVYIVNISNPASMSVVNSGGTAVGGNPQGIYVSGRYAYVANNADNTLTILDVSDPSTPTTASTTTLAASNTASGVYVQGKYAYITSDAGGATNRFVTLDVSNPSVPITAVSFDPTPYAQGARDDIYVQGRYAYVVNVSSTARLEVIDLGGVYVQQLEVGGIDAGTIGAQGNINTAANLNAQGSGSFGQGINVNGSSSFALTSSSATASTLTLQSLNLTDTGATTTGGDGNIGQSIGLTRSGATGGGLSQTGQSIILSDTSVTTSGTNVNIGQDIILTRSGNNGGSDTNYGQSISVTGTVTSGSVTNYGINTQVSGSIAGTAVNYGVYSRAGGIVDGFADSNYGGYFSANSLYISSGTIGQAVGAQGSVNLSTATFGVAPTTTITDAMALRGLLSVDGSLGGTATITNGHGLYIDAASINTGAITNNYGVLIKAQTAGTADYGVAIEATDTTAGNATLWLSSNTDSTTATGGITFGSSKDTNLYRSAANTLKTDDGVEVTGNLGVGVAPGTYKLNVNTDTASGYAANFFNDGNNANRYGIRVQAGADDASGTTYFLDGYDGDGNQVGYVGMNAGTFQVVNVSDAATKTNIDNTDTDALDILGQLRVVDFNRIQNPDGPRITGFIAQEVQDIYSQAVSVTSSGLLGVSNDAFIPILVKGVQQQQGQIDSLGNKVIGIEGLDGKISDLEARVDQLAVQQGQGSSSNFADLNVSGMATIQNLTVTGAATVGELTVTGNATFAGNITIQGHVLGNVDTRGMVTVPAGQTEFKYTFVKPYTVGSEPYVILTPKNTFAPSYRVESTDKDFTIYFQTASATDVQMNYQVQE